MSGNKVRFRAAFTTKVRPETAPEPLAAVKTETPPASRQALQLALAYFIEGEIEAGRIKSYAEVASRLGISRARVSQIAGMVLLPMAVQEAIVEGDVAVSETALRKTAW